LWCSEELSSDLIKHTHTHCSGHVPDVRRAAVEYVRRFDIYLFFTRRSVPINKSDEAVQLFIHTHTNTHTYLHTHTHIDTQTYLHTHRHTEIHTHNYVLKSGATNTNTHTLNQSWAADRRSRYVSRCHGHLRPAPQIKGHGMNGRLVPLLISGFWDWTERHYQQKLPVCVCVCVCVWTDAFV